MLEERRDNGRAEIICAMSVSVGSSHIEGKTRNVSTGGILAEITEGDSSTIPQGSHGTVIVDYHGRDIECQCQVLRITNKAIALAFEDPQFEQVMMIKRMIEENC